MGVLWGERKGQRRGEEKGERFGRRFGWTVWVKGREGGGRRGEVWPDLDALLGELAEDLPRLKQLPLLRRRKQRQ